MTLLEQYERQAVILGQERVLPLAVREQLAHSGLLRFLGLPEPLNFDAHTNFAYSTVLTAPSPASSGPSLVVQSGDGTKFPAAPFNATVWPAGAQPTTANAEIVRVTTKVGDTLTITRAQEGSTARAIGVGDQIANTITTKVLTDIESLIGGSEIGYDQVTTASITVASTTEATPTTLVAASAHTFDGSPVLVQFFCPRVSNPSSSGMIVGLYESGSSIARLGFTPPTVLLGLSFFYRFTPTAGSHTYTVSAFGQAAANGAFLQGAGGANTEVPMFVRFTKV